MQVSTFGANSACLVLGFPSFSPLCICSVQMQLPAISHGVAVLYVKYIFITSLVPIFLLFRFCVH